MKATRVEATKTNTERTVTITYDDGAIETYIFGQVQDKNGAWGIPKAADVAREVKALVRDRIARAGATTVTPDDGLEAELQELTA